MSIYQDYASMATQYGVQAFGSTQTDGGETTAAQVTGPMAHTDTNGSGSTAVNQVMLFPQLEGTIIGNPVFQLFLIAFVAMGVFAMIHSHVKGVEKDLGTPRIGLGSFFSIGIQAMVFIVIMKIVFTKYHIPGFSEVVATA